MNEGDIYNWIIVHTVLSDKDAAEISTMNSKATQELKGRGECLK